MRAPAAVAMYRGLVPLFVALVSLWGASSTDQPRLQGPSSMSVPGGSLSQELVLEDTWSEQGAAKGPSKPAPRLPMMVLSPGELGHAEEAAGDDDDDDDGDDDGDGDGYASDGYDGNGDADGDEDGDEDGDGDGGGMARLAPITSEGVHVGSPTAKAHAAMSKHWYDHEGAYAKVSCLIAMLLAVLGVLALTTTNFVRYMLRNCLSSVPSIAGIRAAYKPYDRAAATRALAAKAYAQLYGDEAPGVTAAGGGPERETVEGVSLKIEGGFTRSCIQTYHGPPETGIPMPKGARESHDRLFSRFTLAVLPLALMATVCYLLKEGGSFALLATAIYSHTQVLVTPEDLAEECMAVLAQFGFALVLLYGLLSFSVDGCLSKQKGLRTAHMGINGKNPMSSKWNFYKEEKKLLEGYLKEEGKGLLVPGADVHDFDYSRYMAACIDNTITTVSELTISSWLVLALCEVLLWLLLVYVETSTTIARQGQVVVVCLGPLLGVMLWAWVPDKPHTIKVVGSKEDSITWLIGRCDGDSTWWPVVVLQASSFVTCFTGIRILTALFRDPSGTDASLVLMLLAFFVVLLTQMIIVADLTRKCAIVFNLAPYIRSQNKDLIRRDPMVGAGIAVS